jgi:membrane protein
VSAQDLLEQATDTSVLGVSAALGVAVLLVTGLGWISALREGIRSMFQMPVMALDPVRSKLYDLAVLLSLGTLIVLIALVSVVTQAFTEDLLQLVGLEGSQVGNLVTSTIVFVVSFALNTVVFTVLFKVLARSTSPYRAIVGGAALAAFGIAVLQVLVGVVLGGVGGGFGFLKTFVPILALIVWLNLNARVLLFGAAWVAVGPTGGPEAATADVADRPAVVAPPLPPVLPPRWTDRVVLGAGVVLGASAVGLATVVRGGVRAAGGGLREMLRRDDD